MDSKTVRKTFLDFFASRQHELVSSAPMVIKNDPTLMFTNAGMNQFKDIFLGNSQSKFSRVANTQKCLRVSGKHNDLEEVGHDTYHHTMFEMLGNWSFGDYFKKEAIAWAWELLTDVYKIDKSKLYVTVFGGDESEHLTKDVEAYQLWKELVPEEKILWGSKKDNFWEMGDSGPCGPCSEIHIDLRSDEERKNTDGRELVNTGHSLVIEIWNLVFIELNRLSGGTLENLPAKHVDTGMGFERLCMVMQGVQSNYETDVFQPIIRALAGMTGIPSGHSPQTDSAMQVVADHLRAISFAIADGQLPSNNKAGYVIRRILRRAVRYGFTFLGFKEAFISKLVPVLADHMGSAFPELLKQQELISKVIAEEELAFLRTLAAGIQRFESVKPKKGMVDGKFAFDLFDTYGFPIDLTQLMAREKGLGVDMEGFERCMLEQKNRSKKAATVDKSDWTIVNEESGETNFVGYENTQCSAKITRYRAVRLKDVDYFQLVLDITPFYAESGGQVGDRGWLECANERITVENTVKENNLIIHIVKKLPSDPSESIKAIIDDKKRFLTACNHTATHLLHAALKKVLGDHVEQKGSLVDFDRLRFDFSHYSAVKPDEMRLIEKEVFSGITSAFSVKTDADVPIEEARTRGAIALFGEKYGDSVRIVSIGEGYSVELCGGTHVDNTGRIGFFLIVDETAIAAGMRRIEAISGQTALDYIHQDLMEPSLRLREILKKPVLEIPATVEGLIEQNTQLKKQIELLNKKEALGMKEYLKERIKLIDGINFIAEQVDLDANSVKDLSFALKDDIKDLFLVLAYESSGKPGLAVTISENLVNEKGFNASSIVRELAKEIQGGGGGQNFFATAGGKDASGLQAALKKATGIISKQVQ